jgi:hypothetical protein
MTIPAMTAPEIFFGVLVLGGFSAFALTLAGTHLYTIIKPRARREADDRALAGGRPDRTPSVA